MSNFDFHRLDGQILRSFLVVLEEGSVSRAADRLGVTQSAVSHTLSKLRRILGDPLFVRSGQGLVPTETALALKTPVQDVLDRMRALTDQRAFDPGAEPLRFVVAANDMQRDLIFPALAHGARADGIDLTLEFRPSGVPSVSMLRDARCDLLVTPLPPDAADLRQAKLFSGQMRVFYDPDHRDAPGTIGDYLASDHIDVHFALGGAASDVLRAPDLPQKPRPRITVSNFAGIPPFLLGTRMITTQIDAMRLGTLRQLAMAPLPFHADPVSVFMVWHDRSAHDPAHRWLRDQVRAIARRIG